MNKIQRTGRRLDSRYITNLAQSSSSTQIISSILVSLSLHFDKGLTHEEAMFLVSCPYSRLGVPLESSNHQGQNVSLNKLNLVQGTSRGLDS